MNKNKQKIGFITPQINHSFTGTKLTKFAGLSPKMKFINKLMIGNQLNELFPTEKTNAIKFRASLKTLIGALRNPVWQHIPVFR